MPDREIVVVVPERVWGLIASRADDEGSRVSLVAADMLTAAVVDDHT